MSESKGSSQHHAPFTGSREATGSFPSDLQEAPTHVKAPSSRQANVDVSSSGRSDLLRELLGATLDHFELLDCIGVGGMGRVFRARDTRLDRLVALKVLAPSLANDAEMLRRFEQEAKAAGRLDHPSFASVYFFGNDKGLSYIAMEYVEGENLRKQIDRAQRLPVAFVLPLAMQIAQGLEYASRCGVIHRDIKPSNIIVNPTGQAKLVDMGLARDFLQHSAQSQLTQVGATLGTCDYISPEQARDPRDVDVRSDIYSLGCTLYHALTGQPPFPEGTALQKLLHHQNDPVPDPRLLVPDLPEPVVQLVAKMTAKDPGRRHQSPRDLLTELCYVGSMVGVTVASEWVPPVEPPPSFWERQLVWVGPTAGTALVLCLYFVSYLAVPSSPTDLAAFRQRAVTPNVSPSPTVSTNPLQVVVPASANLVTAIAEAAPGATLLLKGDLYRLDGQTIDNELVGLVLDKKITIKRENATGLTRLQLINTGDRETARTTRSVAVTLLSIQSNDVVLEGLLLDIPAVPLMIPADGRALRLRGGTVRLERCVINGSADLNTSKPGIGVEIDSTSAEPLTLEIAKTVFAQGKEALRVRSPDANVLVAWSQVGVRDFAVPFRVENYRLLTLKLEHVSVRGVRSAVFQLNRTENAAITSKNCVYSNDLNRLPGAKPPALASLTSTSADMPSVSWTAEANLFHGLNVLLRDNQGRDLVTELGGGGFGFGMRYFDCETVKADQPLWEEPATEDRPAASTQVPPGTTTEVNWGARFAQVAARRRLTVDGQYWGMSEGPLGPVESGRPEPARSPLDEVLAGDANELRVIAGRPSPVFSQLRHALEEARDGAVISLATNEELSEADLPIDGKAVTIRAAEGFRPRLGLRIDPETQRRDPAKRVALFRIGSTGRLTIEGVPLVIKNQKSPPASVTPERQVCLAECLEGGSLRIEGAWLRLENVDNTPVTLMSAIAAPPSRDRLANVPPPRRRTQLVIERCRVSTRGGLVVADPLVDWQARIESSLVDADGAMFQVAGRLEPSTDSDVNPFVSRAPSEIDIAQSTLLLRQPFVEMSAVGTFDNQPRGVSVSASGTVFLGLSGRRPFTRIVRRGNVATLADDSAIAWRAEDAMRPLVNFVAGFDNYLEVSLDQPAMVGELTTSTASFEDWLLRTRLPANQFLQGKTQPVDSFIPSETEPPSSEELRAWGWSARLNPDAVGVDGNDLREVLRTVAEDNRRLRR